MPVMRTLGNIGCLKMPEGFFISDMINFFFFFFLCYWILIFWNYFTFSFFLLFFVDNLLGKFIALVVC